MITSEEGRSAIALREGIRNKAYKDTKGIWTIGVGHTGPEVVEGLVWSDDKVMSTLVNDLRNAEKAVNLYVKVALTQNQFDALVSFVFNVGAGAFKNSTLLKVLNQGNYEEAANQFDRWHIPPEITSRRNSEQTQFLQA